MTVSPDDISLRNDCEAAMELYHGGCFEDAQSRFSQISAVHPDDLPTRALAVRCAAMVKDPPLNWDGVFIASLK